MLAVRVVVVVPRVLVGMVRTALLGMLMAALVVRVARRVLVAPVVAGRLRA